MTAAEGWLSDVTFWVDGVPSGGAAPAPGGGSGSVPTGGQGFSLSTEEARRMLDSFKRIYNDLVGMEAESRQLLEMRAAAEDPASLHFHESAVGGIGRGAFFHGHEHLQKEITFFAELVARLEKALGLIADSDEDAKQQIGAAGGSVARENRGFLE
ncbi:hypothetical protein [Saccharomonospora cyanea]|uniref:Uncharacterized protein n=1 Tax=Saccharomonospora cyanea NA-134 TaxID=882082 RepID=H5XD57_9PSEU|nr:hypothetical protein [Saccharomonospora cyanea]EHR63488.1 hypothetical protein SaccyDRAFT_4681 [Saccharomonospora cyanea NA-134]